MVTSALFTPVFQIIHACLVEMECGMVSSPAVCFDVSALNPESASMRGWRTVITSSSGYTWCSVSAWSRHVIRPGWCGCGGEGIYGKVSKCVNVRCLQKDAPTEDKRNLKRKAGTDGPGVTESIPTLHCLQRFGKMSPLLCLIPNCCDSKTCCKRGKERAL